MHTCPASIYTKFTNYVSLKIHPGIQLIPLLESTNNELWSFVLKNNQVLQTS